MLGYIAGYRPNSFITRQLQRFVPPGGSVLDLGAHVGTFSLTAAALGYRVVAVDASPIHIDLLNRSVARNGFRPSQLRVVHSAVGDTTGTVEFHLGGLWGMVAQPRPRTRGRPGHPTGHGAPGDRRHAPSQSRLSSRSTS